MFYKRIANTSGDLNCGQSKDPWFDPDDCNVLTVDELPDESSSINSNGSEAGSLKGSATSTKGVGLTISSEDGVFDHAIPEQIKEKHKEFTRFFLEKLKNTVMFAAAASVKPYIQEASSVIKLFEELVKFDRIFAFKLFPFFKIDLEMDKQDSFFQNNFLENTSKNKYEDYLESLKVLISVLNENKLEHFDFMSFKDQLSKEMAKISHLQDKNLEDVYNLEVLQDYFNSSGKNDAQKFIKKMDEFKALNHIFSPLLHLQLKCKVQVEKVINLLYLGACTKSGNYASLVILLEYLFDDTADSLKRAIKPEEIKAFRSICMRFTNDPDHYLSQLFASFDKENGNKNPFFSEAQNKFEQEHPKVSLYFPVLLARALRKLSFEENYKDLTVDAKMNFIRKYLAENSEVLKITQNLFDIVNQDKFKNYLENTFNKDQEFWKCLAAVDLSSLISSERPDPSDKTVISRDIYLRMCFALKVFNQIHLAQESIDSLLGSKVSTDNVLQQYFKATDIEQCRRKMPWTEQYKLPQYLDVDEMKQSEQLLANLEMMSKKYLAVRYTAAGARTCAEAQMKELSAERYAAADTSYKVVHDLVELFYEGFNDKLFALREELNAMMSEKKALEDNIENAQSISELTGEIDDLSKKIEEKSKDIELWAYLKIFDLVHVLKIAEVNDRIPTEYQEHDPGTLSGTLFETVLHFYGINFKDCYELLKWVDTVKRAILMVENKNKDPHTSYFEYRDLDPEDVIKKVLENKFFQEGSKEFKFLNAMLLIEKKLVTPILKFHEAHNNAVILKIANTIESPDESPICQFAQNLKEVYDGWNEGDSISGNEAFHWLNPKSKLELSFQGEIQEALDQKGIPFANVVCSDIKGRYFRVTGQLDKKAGEIRTFELPILSNEYLQSFEEILKFLSSCDSFDVSKITNYFSPIPGSDHPIMSFFQDDPSISDKKEANEEFKKTIEEALEKLDQKHSRLTEKNLKNCSSTGEESIMAFWQEHEGISKQSIPIS